MFSEKEGEAANISWACAMTGANLPRRWQLEEICPVYYFPFGGSTHGKAHFTESWKHPSKLRADWPVPGWGCSGRNTWERKGRGGCVVPSWKEERVRSTLAILMLRAPPPSTPPPCHPNVPGVARDISGPGHAQNIWSGFG